MLDFSPRSAYEYPDSTVREAARRSELPAILSELYFPEAERLSDVRARLRSESAVARADVVEDLGAVFSTRTAAALLPEVARLLISDENRRVRSACAWCLCQWGGEHAKAAMAELLQASHDEEDSVRLWAVRALSRLELERDEVGAVLPALAERLLDVDSDVRSSAEEGVVAHALRL
jgi:HEAT repeat protein